MYTLVYKIMHKQPYLTSRKDESFIMGEYKFRFDEFWKLKFYSL